MKNSGFWLMLVIVLLLIIFVLYFNFCSKDDKQVKVVETEIAPSQISEKRVNDLESRIVNLEQRVSDLEERPQVTRVAPAPTPAPARAPEPKAHMADLSHLKDVNGDIIFCVMANKDGGMHFPQYALERDVEFGGIQANTTKDGNNWLVNPISSIEGDYGITYDGTFFVSHDVLSDIMSETLHTLAIKSKFTNWQPRDMTKEGNYWIYKTR